MSLSPAKVRVEIFREPGFFDDNFCKGWTKTSGGTSSFSTDGDVASLNKGDQVGCSINKSFASLSSNVYTKLQVRVTAISGQLSFYVNCGVGGWLFVGSTSVVGLVEYTIPTGETMTQVALSTADTASVEYCAITKNSLLVPDLGDLVEELVVTRPLLNDGICGAKFSIPNFAGAYNGLIKGQDAIIIWIARDDANLGVPAYKAFGGRVVNSGNRGDSYGAFYIDLDCHGHGYELNIPPALLQVDYPLSHGRIIIEAALALCAYLTYHPYPNFWFDYTGSSGSTDDRINSYHTVVYDEEVPMTVFQEILEKAKNPASVRGFDAYETPAGCVIGHLRNSLDFTSPISTLTPEKYLKGEDVHRIRNKQKVYGQRLKMLGDLAESISNWSSDGDTYGQSSADVKEGTYAIVASDAAAQSIYLLYDFPTAISCKFSHQYGKLHLWVKVDAASFDAGAYVEIQLRTDSGNIYGKIFESPQKGKWTEYELDIGPSSEWIVVAGAPNWGSIGELKVGFSNVPTSSALTLKVDGVRFTTNFESTAEDATSQTAYGVRMAIPIVDESLKSDNECSARALSILAVLKDPVITLSDVVVDGDHRYNPGDRQRVVVANDGLDAYFRMLEVKHRVKGTQWDVTLTLNNEPQFIDYVFKLVQEAQKLLERRN